MMKRIILTTFVAGFAMAVSAQDAQDVQQNEVPEQAVKSFYEEYASAEDVEWQKEGEEYTAEFSLNNEEKKAKLDQNGKVQMTETKIERNALPQSVQKTLQTDYPEFEADEFAEVEKEGKTHFKVKGKMNGEDKEMMFDKSGKEVEKSKSEMKNKKSKS